MRETPKRRRSSSRLKVNHSVMDAVTQRAIRGMRKQDIIRHRDICGPFSLSSSRMQAGLG